MSTCKDACKLKDDRWTTHEQMPMQYQNLRGKSDINVQMASENNYN